MEANTDINSAEWVADIWRKHMDRMYKDYTQEELWVLACSRFMANTPDWKSLHFNNVFTRIMQQKEGVALDPDFVISRVKLLKEVKVH